MEPVDQQAQEERLAGGQPVLAKARRPGEDLEQGGDSLRPGRRSTRRDRTRQSRSEALAELGQAVVAVGRELAQRREAGRRRDRVAV
jgi:hypothetical protein